MQTASHQVDAAQPLATWQQGNEAAPLRADPQGISGAHPGISAARCSGRAAQGHGQPRWRASRCPRHPSSILADHEGAEPVAVKQTGVGQGKDNNAAAAPLGWDVQTPVESTGHSAAARVPPRCRRRQNPRPTAVAAEGLLVKTHGGEIEHGRRPRSLATQANHTQFRANGAWKLGETKLRPLLLCEGCVKNRCRWLGPFLLTRCSVGWAAPAMASAQLKRAGSMASTCDRPAPSCSAWSSGSPPHPHPNWGVGSNCSDDAGRATSSPWLRHPPAAQTVASPCSFFSKKKGKKKPGGGPRGGPRCSY